ncbi:MAG: hypothetical protein ACE5FG_03490 [Myxococcota bacterium]
MRHRLTTRLVALLPLLGADLVAAQQGLPPRVDEATLALNYIQGRFTMPVTCVRRDGSTIEVAEAIVIRPAPQQGGEARLRATFFGIDVSDVERCYNLVHSRIPDRRGILYLSYRHRAHHRPDLGMSDFRHELATGELRYRIEHGTLRERPPGTPENAWHELAFDGGGYELVVSEVKHGSDGEKLLGSPPAAIRGRVPRHLVFELQGPKGFAFTGYYVEDARRWR